MSVYFPIPHYWYHISIPWSKEKVKMRYPQLRAVQVIKAYICGPWLAGKIVK